MNKPTPEDVRGALARLDLSQAWLAKQLGVSDDVVSRLLHPNQKLLARALSILGRVK